MSLFVAGLIVAAAGALATLGAALLLAGTRSQRPTVAPRGHTRALGLLLVAVGVSCMSIGGVLSLLLAPARERLDQAIHEFVSAARSGDRKQLYSLATPDAQLDERLLFREAPRSRSIRFGSSTMDSDAACVEVILLPARTRVVLALIKPGESWKIARAAAEDAPCQAEFDR